MITGLLTHEVCVVVSEVSVFPLNRLILCNSGSYFTSSRMHNGMWLKNSKHSVNLLHMLVSL